MRISDWSSDVYSTYLPLLDRVAPVEADQVADQPVDVPDPVAHPRQIVRVGGAQQRLGKHVVQIFADRAALVQRPPLVEDRRHHPQRIEAQVRSEEHTSELQSLMRISEAVISIKKK